MSIPTVQPDSCRINLIHGDDYDGVAHAKLIWTSAKNVDAATDFYFAIRGLDDTLILDHATAGVTVTGSGTTVEVALTNAATELLPAEDNLFFDLKAIFTTSKYTITTGICSVIKDVCRTIVPPAE